MNHSRTNLTDDDTKMNQQIDNYNSFSFKFIYANKIKKREKVHLK